MRTAAPSARRRGAPVGRGGGPGAPAPSNRPPRPGGRGKSFFRGPLAGGGGAAGPRRRAAGAGVQRKLVFRRLDGDAVAFLQPLVHEARAATAPGLVAHGDQVLVRRAGGG